VIPRQLAKIKYYNKRIPSQFWLGGVLKRNEGGYVPPERGVVFVNPWQYHPQAVALGAVGATDKLKFTRGGRS
jgi:hypothetical protein